MSRVLRVLLHGRLAGLLRQGDDGRLGFQYDAEYVADPSAFPLSWGLPKTGVDYGHAASRAFFGGILPEGEVRVRLARALRVSERNDFALLAEVGGECAGAVALEPEAPPAAAVLATRRLLDNAALGALLKLLPDKPLLVAEGVRLSLAGAQYKLALVREGGAFWVPAAGEPTTHILKMAAPGLDGVLENEALCTALARAVGLEAPVATLERAEGTAFLCVERYDRVRDAQGRLARLHQEDFCQALGVAPEQKYQSEGGPSLAQSLDLVGRASVAPAVDQQRLLRLACFNFVVGNADAHAKNFALLWHGGRIRLAPAYDLVDTLAYPQLTPRMAMKIGDEYDARAIRRRHWRDQALAMDVKAALVLDLLEDVARRVQAEAPRIAGELRQAWGPAPVLDDLVRGIEQRALALLA